MHWFERDGTPHDFNDPESRERFDQLLGDLDYKRVIVEEVGGYVVSTVWLGIDHSFGFLQQPVIFETMVFAAPGTDDELGWDQSCNRYSTEEEARAGHNEFVTLLRATVPEGPEGP